MEATYSMPSSQSQALRLAALFGVIGPVLFVVLVIVGGILYDGYSHVGQKISELGGEGAEYALLQSLNFIVLGVSIIAFAWALARFFGAPYRGPVLIGLFGLSSGIGNGLLPCDLSCEGATTVGLLHNVTGLVGFVAALVGMVLLSRRWRTDQRWASHARFTRAMLVVAIGGFAWWFALNAMDSTFLVGIAQRVFVGALLVWIVVTAARLYREITMEGPEPSPAGSSPTT